MTDSSNKPNGCASLLLEPPVVEGEWLTLAASLDDPDGKRHRLWWRVPAARQSAITTWADPFVVSFVVPMMKWRRPVHVEGKVSPSLLANLEGFMSLMHAWFPRTYEPVSLTAAEEVEPPPATRPGEAIAAFSCGVDACFTVYQHQRKLLGRRSQRIGAAMLIHGFDIHLHQPRTREIFDGLLGASREVLASVGLEPTPVATNFRDLPTDWRYSAGTHLVGGLTLFQGAFDRALVANCVSLAVLQIPWGTHLLAKSLLGSDRFRVYDDGYEFIRPEKLLLIADWPEAMRNLRVCFKNTESHLNCGRCHKCVRTILSFRAAGLPLPPALPHDVTDRQIRNTKLDNPSFPRQWTRIVQWALSRGRPKESWMRAALACERRHHRRHRYRAFKRRFVPIRNFFRRVFRGSPLSRRQRTKQTEVSN